MAETIIIRKWHWPYILGVILVLLITCGGTIGVYLMPSTMGPDKDRTLSDHDEGVLVGLLISVIWAFASLILWDTQRNLYERIELCKQTRKVT